MNSNKKEVNLTIASILLAFCLPCFANQVTSTSTEGQQVRDLTHSETDSQALKSCYLAAYKLLYLNYGSFQPRNSRDAEVRNINADYVAAVNVLNSRMNKSGYIANSNMLENVELSRIDTVIYLFYHMTINPADPVIGNVTWSQFGFYPVQMKKLNDDLRNNRVLEEIKELPECSGIFTKLRP